MKVAIGQFGAPTAVLNASLFGALQVLDDAGAEVFGVIGGVRGLIHGDWFDLSRFSRHGQWLLRTPGAALRAGRYADFHEVVDQAVEQLRQKGIDALIVMGGNGTMGLGAALHDAARAKGYPLAVIGVPKTIDNDIVGIDHTPGYPSAARFVIEAVRDLTLDLEAMVGFEQVRIVEVMGRRCGWLAAAAAVVPYLSPIPGTVSPRTISEEELRARRPLILLPEFRRRWEEVLTEIKERVHHFGHLVVVVSEGVTDANGKPVLHAGDDSTNSARSMLGGIGAVLADQVRQVLGLGARYENLGVLQRCWSGSSTTLDRQEALMLGRRGAELVLAGKSAQMVGLSRRPALTYQVEFIERPLVEIAGRDRLMTAQEQCMDVAFIQWLAPLVELEQIHEHPRISEKFINSV
ncbi:diphosphate--fructose-6-phosphate 1-phosphotransferase [Alicyclobacillus macrosporangiidus]|uniref:diphosphate--fructose-6-phosphate 1-phosphotransferase n=1 Tax=Alicyclobacillus macrosporangiidus TaxID=392015 RepID=UPI000497A063|nr:diphosphate--fructose-6-phosphate 1-phosphotransferase [Alicyclobacillus macrosporangiidus]